MKVKTMYVKRKFTGLDKALLFVIAVLVIVIIVLQSSMLRLSDETTQLVMKAHVSTEISDETIASLELRISILEGEIKDLKEQSALSESLNPPREDVKLVNETEEPDFAVVDDIPLSADLQAHTYEVSEKYSVPFSLLIAVMDQESDFRTSLRSSNENGTTDIGIMQINSSNKKMLKSKYNLDIEDSYDNIEAGAVMLADLLTRYSVEEALAAYNLGEGGLQKHGVNKYAGEVYALYLDYSSILSEVGR